MCRVAETLDGMPCFVQKRIRRTSCPSKLPGLCPAIRERHGASRMALTLRLTLRSHGRQTVVLREFSTHPRSGERSYI